MKQLKFTFLLCLFLIASNHIHAQLDTAQKISLSLNNASLFDLVKSIEDQTEYRFYFDTAQLSKQTYSIEISKAPLSQVLVTLLTPYKIYAIIDKEGYIFLSKDPLLNLMLPNAYFTGIQKNNVSGNINNFIEPDDPMNAQVSLADNKLYEIGEKSLAAANIITMAGYIIDLRTGEPVAGASIYIDKPRIGVSSDQNGYYAISLPRGKHILNIQSLGIRDIKRQIVLYSDGKMDIDATGSIMSLKKVVISAQKISNVRGTIMGVQKLDIKTVKQVPVVFGEADILRVITTLPGVKTVGEASTGLNVRGGSSDQNLILFNDATIYNPAHFLACSPLLIQSSLVM